MGECKKKYVQREEEYGIDRKQKFNFINFLCCSQFLTVSHIFGQRFLNLSVLTVLLQVLL